MELPRLRSAHTYDRLSDSAEPATHDTTAYVPNEPGTNELQRQVDTDKYLIWAGVFWLIFTIIINTIIVVAVRLYQLKGTFSPAQKHAFNTISTFLLLVLGLNFFVSRSVLMVENMANEYATS